MTLLPEPVIVDGHRIATGVHGDGPPVVLIHGTPSHSFIWRNVVPPLTGAGYRVHLFDLLGFGLSERPQDAETDTSVAYQGEVLRHLMGHWDLDDAHIVAHDIGGAVAMRTGVLDPELVRSLTLIDTVSYDSWPSETWRAMIANGLDALMRAPDAEHRERLTQQLTMTVADPARMSGDVLDAYLEAVSGPIGQPSFFQHQVRHYDSGYTQELTDDLDELGEHAVQIIWGRQDSWQDPAYATKLAHDIPGASLHMIDDAGHFVMEDQPEAVAAQIRSFVGANEGAGDPGGA
jgi:pimeloyl-ACP methyl ester carboxylesterase